MTTTNQKCLVILLNWNGTTDTLACCQSLINERGLYDVLIIDNASGNEQYQALLDGMGGFLDISPKPDGADEALMAEYHVDQRTTYRHQQTSFYVLKSTVNHGFARGCNLGAWYAKNHHYETVLFLNNDTVVEDNFFPLMLNALEKCDGVIPQIRYFHDKNLIWNCGGDISKYGKRTYHFANKQAQPDAPGKADFPITFATGCALLFRSDYFIKLGLFSEKFFFGEEDIDLSLRLKSLQARLICTPESIIYHKVGASLVGDRTKILRKAYIHYLNRFVNMRNHLGLMWYPWLLPSTLKILINVIRINKLSPGKALNFTWRLLKEACVLNEVNKAKFETVLKNGY